MNALSEAAQLRPLSIGEMFDRAVTLLVKNAAPLAIVALVGVLPAHVIDYFAAITGNAALRPLATLANALELVAAMATAAIVSQLYAGNRADWLTAIATGFKRILRAVGVNIMLAVVALIPAGIVVGVAVPAGIFRFGNPLAVIAAVIVGLALAAWLLAFLLASLYSYCAIAIDDRDSGDCVVKAFGLFAKPNALRNLLFALAAGAVLFGGSFVAGFLQGFLRTVLHFTGLAYGIEALLLMAVMAFVHTLVPVFYYDTRIREEGYDMQAMLAALEPVQ